MTRGRHERAGTSVSSKSHSVSLHHVSPSRFHSVSPRQSNDISGSIKMPTEVYEWYSCGSRAARVIINHQRKIIEKCHFSVLRSELVCPHPQPLLRIAPEHVFGVGRNFGIGEVDARWMTRRNFRNPNFAEYCTVTTTASPPMTGDIILNRHSCNRTPATQVRTYIANPGNFGTRPTVESRKFWNLGR
jgi:hypothetical protein